MDSLSSLNSIVEVLTAFNFAFVASTTFLNDLNLKITGSFGAVQEEMNNVKTRIKEISSYIDKGLSSGVNTAAFADRQVELDDLILTKDKYKSEIKSDIEKLSASKAFQRYSLFSGIYSVMILFLASYEDSIVTDLFMEMLIIFSWTALLFLVWMNWPTKLKIGYPWKPGIWDIIITFLFGALIAFLSFLIFEIWFGLECTADLTFEMKLTIILVPSAHFLFYFINSLLKSKQMGKKKLVECNKLLEDLNNLANRVQGNLDVYTPAG